MRDPALTPLAVSISLRVQILYEVVAAVGAKLAKVVYPTVPPELHAGQLAAVGAPVALELLIQ
jgi:hypothetical protein